MGQRLSSEAASTEALRLLNLAMAILDDAGFLAPQCYISHAVDMLEAPEPRAIDDSQESALKTDWHPAWGQISDLPTR